MSEQLAVVSERVAKTPIPECLEDFDIIARLTFILNGYRLPHGPYRSLTREQRAQIPSIRNQVAYMAGVMEDFATSATSRIRDPTLAGIRLAQVSELVHRGITTYGDFTYLQNDYGLRESNPYGDYVRITTGKAASSAFQFALNKLYPARLHGHPEVRRLAAQSRGVGRTALIASVEAKLGLACMDSHEGLVASQETLFEAASGHVSTPDLPEVFANRTAIHKWREFTGSDFLEPVVDAFGGTESIIDTDPF